jgi:hypothetical protein
MTQPTRTRRSVVVRRVSHPRAELDRNVVPAPAPPAGPMSIGQPALETARRIGESFVIAAVSSAGLYLVGTVYTQSYYSRLSIETTSLDLAPPFVALQSVHATQGLLQYPSTLLLFYLLYRTFAAPGRRLRPWIDRMRLRFPRLLPAIANVIVIAPLIVSAFITSLQEQEMAAQAVVTPVADVLGDASLILLGYAIWLGWTQRAFIVSLIRARRLVPIALVFIVYLLNALTSTASSAALAAELLMTGSSDASMGIVFTAKEGTSDVLAGKDLILVTARQGTFYVVERQPIPPSQRPLAYMVPAASVKVASVRRLNDADLTLDDFDLIGSPVPPDP